MTNPDIPRACTVLVVGGGPGGSYAAASLALEGKHVVLLEADKFPRYHIGESMLPAMRHLLRFIDLDSTFDNHGFTKKVGAAFKLSIRNREGYTDFLAAGGPDNYSWNVVRSEADNILFQHAAKCGAKVFDGIKVNTISFQDCGDPLSSRPVSASYSRRDDGACGEISFDYIIDASGRAGLMSTKYFKNREYNKDLKNVASWSYWENVDLLAMGSERENTPFFEALTDCSGWAWFIPLHTSTSIGIVMNKDAASHKKQSMSPPPTGNEFYLSQLKFAPTLLSYIGNGKQVIGSDGKPEFRGASDYSYMASFYGSPGLRVVGDAGAFIDPLFSSGVHLAMTSGLSAALTICAVLRGDCSEEEAARWHSDKVAGSFSWFQMVILGTYKQITAQDEPVLSDIDEDNFDRAFEFLRPVIQGSVDIFNYLSKEELTKTLEFCSTSWESTQPELRDSVLRKISRSLQPKQISNCVDASNLEFDEISSVDEGMSAEEQRLLAYMKSRKLLRTEDVMSIRNFSADIVLGRRPRLQRGDLGLEYVGSGQRLADAV